VWMNKRKAKLTVMITTAYSVAADAGLAGHLNAIYNHGEPEKSAQLVVERGVQNSTKCRGGMLVSQNRGCVIEAPKPYRLMSTVGCR
jgi:hypothetical protein